MLIDVSYLKTPKLGIFLFRSHDNVIPDLANSTKPLTPKSEFQFLEFRRTMANRISQCNFCYSVIVVCLFVVRFVVQFVVNQLGSSVQLFG